MRVVDPYGEHRRPHRRLKLQRIAFSIVGLIAGVIIIVLAFKVLNDDPGLTEAAPDKLNREDGARTVTVRMKDERFIPDNVSVGPGQTVRWVNQDDAEHTVTARGGGGESFDSGAIKGGETYERTFLEAGPVDYVSTLDDGMRGTVSVVD